MKNRRSVLAVGAILLAVVLLIAFAVPFARTGVFYIALGFEIAAFLVALFAAHVAFEKGEDTRSRFYGFPIARIGAVYLIAETALSLILMALSKICPAWAAAIDVSVCAASADAYSPTTSSRLDGLMLTFVATPSIHSPPM